MPVGWSRPFTVELAGIPGAGKSWLGDAVAVSLAERGLVVAQPQRAMAPAVDPVRRLARKAAAATAASVREPLLSVRLSASVLQSGQGDLKGVAARLLQWQVAQDLLSRPGPSPSVRILDEGPVQCLWSIGLRGDVAPVLATLGACRRWQAADLLVVVRTSPAVAEARLASRTSKHSRTQQLSLEARRPELERGARLLDRLARWWATDVARSEAVVEISGSAAEHDPLVRRIARGADRGALR